MSMNRLLLLALTSFLFSPIAAKAHPSTGKNLSLFGSQWECDTYGNSKSYCYEFPAPGLSGVLNSIPTYLNIYSIPSSGKNRVLGVGAFCKKGCVGKWVEQGVAVFKPYAFSNQHIVCKGLRSVSRGEKYGHCHAVNP